MAKIELLKTDIATCMYLLQESKFKEVGKTKRYIQLSRILLKFEKVYLENRNIYEWFKLCKTREDVEDIYKEEKRNYNIDVGLDKRGHAELYRQYKEALKRFN